MKGFRKVRFAPQTSQIGVGGFPEYGPFIPLYTFANGKELNSVSISITDDIVDSELKADDQVDKTTFKVGYSATLTVYDYDKEAAQTLFGYEVDNNNNLILVENAPPVRGCLFFESQDNKGTRIQNYLYDVKLTLNGVSTETFDGSNNQTIDISLQGSYLLIDGKQTKGALVYQGNVGFVDGEPTTVYKKTDL